MDLPAFSAWPWLAVCYAALAILYTVDFLIWLSMEKKAMATVNTPTPMDTPPTPTPQSGAKTSEFWLVCGASISAFITALNSGDKTGIISTGAVALVGIAGYLWTRHAQKMAAMKHAADDKMASPSSSYGSSRIPDGVPMLLAAMLLFGIAGLVEARPHGGGGVRIGFGFGWYAPPAVIVPIAPQPIVVPVLPSQPPQAIAVDPNRPAFPGYPVYVSPGPTPVYYQFVPVAR